MGDQAAIFALIVGYKIAVLLVGLLFGYMGYRLFIADKSQPAGELAAGSGSYALSLKGGAPGIFFCLFGTVLVCMSIFKGIQYESSNGIVSEGNAVPTIMSPQPPV